MIRTFFHSGVLIAVARSLDLSGECAQRLLDGPDQEFLTNRFVRLEVVPKAIFDRKGLSTAGRCDHSRIAMFLPCFYRNLLPLRETFEIPLNRKSQAKFAMRTEPDKLKVAVAGLPINEDKIWANVAIA